MDTPNIRAQFDAKYLHALRGILDNVSPLDWPRGAGLTIEPAAAGGVLLIATDGTACAVIHDASGAANKAFRVALPKAFRDRCAPAAPLQAFYEGDCEIDMPEWCQPGPVCLTGVCAMLFPQMNHPAIDDPSDAPALANVLIETGNDWRAEDYRVFEGKLPDWRTAFEQPKGPTSRIFYSPKVLAAFEPLRELAVLINDGPRALSIELGGEWKLPAIITIDGFPNFIGAAMPMRPFEVPPLPDFLRRPAAAEEKAQ